MKIIFLDCDGVINGYENKGINIWKLFSKIGLGNWYKKYRRNPFGVHKEKVKRLNKIVKATNAKIVLSSTWRLHWNNKGRNEKKLARLFDKYGIEVIGLTPCDYKKYKTREEEIQYWLDTTNYNIESFVILDDENIGLGNFNKSHVIHTSEIPIGVMITGKGYENTGLKRKHIKQAIKILNGKE